MEVKEARKSLVKQLIVQFELGSDMGAEQSFSNNLDNTLNKHSVGESNLGKDSKKRSNSIDNAQIPDQTLVRTLHHSKSEEHRPKNNRIKRGYQYVTQICPIINGNSFNFPTSDDNNNERQNKKRFSDNLEPETAVISTTVCDLENEQQSQTDDEEKQKHKLKSVTSLRRLFDAGGASEQKKFEPPRIPTKWNSEWKLSSIPCTSEDIIKSYEDLTQSYVEDEFKKIEESMKQANEHLRKIKKGHDCSIRSDSIECVNIYVDQQNDYIDNICDEFGKISISSCNGVEFVEAFNRLGDELVFTTASIECESLYSSDTPKNQIFVKLDNDYSHEECSSSDPNPISSEDESPIYGWSDIDIPVNYNNKREAIPTYVEQCEDTEDSIQTNEIFPNSEKGVRAETIYDSFKNPRIAHVSNLDTTEMFSRETSQLYLEPVPIYTKTKHPAELKLKKDYLIEELISTEEAYLKHLEIVVRYYMPALHSDKLPTFLRGSRYIFGNIKKIYSRSQKFYRVLKKCGKDHEEIGKAFILFTELFELYPLYSKNKPAADYFLIGELKELVMVKEKMLNDRLGLTSHLLTPVQRLGKYILLLEQIQKEVTKSEGVPSENIRKAIAIVRKQMSRGNDFIAIDSIKDCPINLTEDAGSFLMRKNFYILKPKKYEAMMFLFENVVVFTTVDAKNPELFFYKDSIRMNELGIITFEDLPLCFHLKRFSSSRGSKEYQEFVIEATRTKDKKTWTEEIEKRLWEQLVKCKEQQGALKVVHGDRNVARGIIPSRIRKKKSGYKSLPEECLNPGRKSVFYDEIVD